MKKMLVLLFCLTFVFSVSGQDGAAVEACTPNQYVRISDTLIEGGFRTSFDDLVNGFTFLNENRSQIPDFIPEADQLQSTWWTTKVPQLQPCSISGPITSAMGKALDEMLIAASLMQLARPEPNGQYASLAAKHLAAAEAAIAEVTRLREFLSSYVVGSNTVAPTSTPKSATFTPYNQPRTMYITGNAVNIRTASNTQASILTVFSRGTSARVIGEESGASVSGSALWYVLDISGQTGYVHSSLISTSAPAAPQPTARPPSNTNNTSSNSSSAPQPTQPPAPQSPPTQAPVNQAPSDAQICGGATTCGQMASCDQAYACLRTGRSSLDRDHDGVPCESICPGG